MEIKGTAVKITPEYVKHKYPQQYLTWLDSLPSVSREIISQPIYATQWFALTESVIVPTMKVGEMFYSSHEEAARELGRYSAEIALNGIYKIFVKVSSPNFVISRATSVFSTYYNPSDISIIESGSKKVVLKIGRFEKKDELIMHRIAGWMEKTLEITLKKLISINIDNHYSGSNLNTEIVAEWD